MKRLLPMLICCMARLAVAQVAPTAQSVTPDYEPQNVEVHGDGRCTAVRPGDTVHYTLTVEGVAGDSPVFGDLRLKLGRSRELVHGDLTHGGLPAPDFRSLGGGGLGTRDAGDGKMYRFAFKVPKEIFGGTYRGIEVYVHAEPLQPQPQSMYQPVAMHSPKVEVTRHTRNEVHAYCLNVISSFGMRTPRTTAVTNFEPGQVDPPAPVLAPSQPLPPVR